MALSYETSHDLPLPLATRYVKPLTLRRRSRQRVLEIGGLMLLDAAALVINFALVFLLRFKVFGFFYVPTGSVLRFYSELVFWITPAFIGVFAIYRLYSLRVLHGGTTEYRRVVSACTFAIMVLLIMSFFLDEKLVISRAWLLMVWVSTILTICISRFLARRVLYFLRLHGYSIGLTRVLFIGANSEVQQVAEQLTGGRNHPGLEIIGFAGDRRSNGERASGPASSWENQRKIGPAWPWPWLGLPETVREIVETKNVDEVIIASTAISPQELFEVTRALTTSRAQIRLSPSLYQILTTGLEVQEINGVPLVTISKVRITGMNAFLKRFMDIVTSLAVLLAFSPVLVGLALLIKRDSPGSIFHRRQVVGQGGKVFNAYKLRTMAVNGDAILAARPELLIELNRYGKLKDDPRITGLGRFLRKTSLDELPQLINVLLGQMSLVGPRMITYQEMNKFGRWQSNLLTVKPGLTGLWQISGRSNLSYADRVRLDMHYIKNYSLWSDLCILFQTVPVVMKGTGAY
ncbi:MAG: exopolysaccharide biosynthesis polyprenyl glycosylphosphotransferase [Chloroflexi bacterium]|nr:exopolysaccharide biosynthesis polyprenyl glycosylphosphotransferase [Chloroflexota bacterium]